MVTMSKPKNGRDASSPNKKPTYANCRKFHLGKCLVGMGNFFACGKSGNKIKDFPNVKGHNKGSGQANGSNNTPKKNHFYALLSTW